MLIFLHFKLIVIVFTCNYRQSLQNIFRHKATWAAFWPTSMLKLFLFNYHRSIPGDFSTLPSNSFCFSFCSFVIRKSFDNLRLDRARETRMRNIFYVLQQSLLHWKTALRNAGNGRCFDACWGSTFKSPTHTHTHIQALLKHASMIETFRQEPFAYVYIRKQGWSNGERWRCCGVRGVWIPSDDGVLIEKTD